MIYSKEVENMCVVQKGPKHGPAPIPEEGKWIKAKEIKDISGYTHGIGWCAPQQGACKLSLNIKNGIIEEALVETIGCSGMTHSAAMAAEILQGKTLLEALNTDLVCDAINTAMRELFLQIVYGRSQSAFSEGGLIVGAGLEDLGKGLRSQVGTMYGTKAKGVRYLEMAEGYVNRIALDKDDQVCGYEFINFGKLMDEIKKGTDANEARLRERNGEGGAPAVDDVVAPDDRDAEARLLDGDALQPVADGGAAGEREHRADRRVERMVGADVVRVRVAADRALHQLRGLFFERHRLDDVFDVVRTQLRLREQGKGAANCHQ